ncbi:hypothetical protein KR026_007625 [Drosophila bipectinata]|nr:hypothetical protein KR026_007625 [Drosophila bipectinata]
MNSKPLILCTFVAIALCLLHFGSAVPAIGHYTHKRFDSMGGIDFIQVGCILLFILNLKLTPQNFILQVCLNNCVQCKTMLGDYFQGQTCALSCLKFKGKAIPDCEDIASIAPFLNALE